MTCCSGINFLRRHGIDIRIKVLRLVVGAEEIPMDVGIGPRHGRVARVYVQRRTIVPPNTAKRITGVIDQKMGACMFEPSPELPAMAPRTLHEGGREIQMYVINPTDRHVHLAGEGLLGEAHAVYAVRAPLSETAPQVPTDDNPQEDTVGALPEHLTDLYTRSSTQLTPEEQGGLKNLLTQFQGVFARNEFDLGISPRWNTRLTQAKRSQLSRKCEGPPLILLLRKEPTCSVWRRRES